MEYDHQEYQEQGWRQHAALFCAAAHMEFFTFLVSERNSSFAYLVELADFFYQVGRATESPKYLPQQEHVYRVKCLAKIYEYDLEIPILFHRFLLELP